MYLSKELYIDIYLWLSPGSSVGQVVSGPQPGVQVGEGGRDDIAHEQLSQVGAGESGQQLSSDVPQTEPHLLQELLLGADGLRVPGAHLHTTQSLLSVNTLLSSHAPG